MPESLWAAVEDFVPKVHHDRSSWIRMVVSKELAAANALPGDPVAELALFVGELAREHGANAVKAKLQELGIHAANAEELAV